MPWIGFEPTFSWSLVRHSTELCSPPTTGIQHKAVAPAFRMWQVVLEHKMRPVAPKQFKMRPVTPKLKMRLVTPEFTPVFEVNLLFHVGDIILI